MLFRLRSELFSSAISIALAYLMGSIWSTSKHERNGNHQINPRRCRSGSNRLTVIGILPSPRARAWSSGAQCGVRGGGVAMRKVEPGFLMHGGSGGVVGFCLRQLSAAPSFCSHKCRFGRLAKSLVRRDYVVRLVRRGYVVRLARRGFVARRHLGDTALLGCEKPGTPTRAGWSREGWSPCVWEY